MNNIYFTTNPDGKHTEGIGAMAQYQIVCYALSQLYGVNFYFTGFKNLTHYQPHNIAPKKWDKDATNFFNLPLSSKNINLPIVDLHKLGKDLEIFVNTNSNYIINFEPSHLMYFLDDHINDYNVLKILKNLGDGIILPDNLKYYSPNKINVAIHIRRFNSIDNDLNPRREYFDKSKQEVYKQLINTIHQNFPSKDIKYHVFSQGKQEDYYFLKHSNYDITFHIEEHPLISLYHMIKSDILITANSALSYVAHLLGRHKECFVRNTFLHKWNPNSLFIDYTDSTNQINFT